jgi:hypothetical protein
VGQRRNHKGIRKYFKINENKNTQSYLWWHIPVILALGGWKRGCRVLGQSWLQSKTVTETKIG